MRNNYSVLSRHSSATLCQGEGEGEGEGEGFGNSIHKSFHPRLLRYHYAWVCNYHSVLSRHASATLYLGFTSLVRLAGEGDGEGEGEGFGNRVRVRVDRILDSSDPSVPDSIDIV